MGQEELDQLWKSACSELQLEMSAGSYSSWIMPCWPVSATPMGEDRTLIELATPSPFHRNHVDERFYGQIKQALEKKLEHQCELALVVRQREVVSAPEAERSQESNLFNQEDTSQADLAAAISGTSLNPKFGFSNFVVGSSNDLAYAAAKAIVEHPGSKHNPLFIWGGVGVGKTHLMHAVGRALVEKGFRKVRVLTSEQFTNELVGHLRTRSVETFKKKFREADALLIDDIQFIAKKETTQEEFFHTFNELYAKQKQIIMTSDRRPQDIQQVEQRLISRFLGGLTVDIGLPDFEMRCAILRQKAEDLGVVTAPDAIETIANNISTNARELEGRFTGLINFAAAKGSPLTRELVEEHLNLQPSSISSPGGGTGPRGFVRRVRPQELISTIAKHFNIKNKDLVGQNRKSEMVRARQIAMYFLREEMGMQLTRVAHLIGGRDHTTVMYGVKKIQQELNLNETVRQEVNTLRTKLFD
jgi:chromosomal replication initiator protein